MLIKAATERFAADTYVGVRVQDIVADAGVSLTTFYKEFDDREDCLLACFLVMREELMAEVVGGSSHGMTPRSWTRSMIDRVFAYLDENDAKGRLILQETIGGSPRTVAAMWSFLDEVGVFLDGLNMATVAERPGTPIPVHDVGLFIAGGVYAVAARYLRDGTMGDLRKDDETLDAVVDALLSTTAAMNRS